ncbi:21121_t:CDS:2, partial [Gigaspora rosea]
QAAPQNDPTRKMLIEKIAEFTNAAATSNKRLFLTYYQNTKNNSSMATCIDYIFIDEDNRHLISEVNTCHGNSNHLLVECTLQNRRNRKHAIQWRFEERCFKNNLLEKEVLEEIRYEEAGKIWDLCKNSIQSIIRAFRKPKSSESKIEFWNKRISDLREKIAKGNVNEILITQLEEAEVQLGAETKLLSNKWCLRSKTKWIEKGEKSTKLAAEKITAALPQVTARMNKSLTKKITQKDISKVLHTLPNGKSPGTDGLTYEFYKATEKDILPVLETIFNKVLEERKMPESWHKSLITLIPKKASNLEELNNWRPISLVNSDAKIFMKIMADKVNKIPMRGQPTTLDAVCGSRKAFDLVSHDYLGLVLQKMNFDSKITKLILNLFNNQEAHIVKDEELSSPFKVERGVHQGDPPTLPALILGSHYFKLVVYVDDLTIGIRKISDREWIEELFGLYEAASNARLNKVKMKLCPLTPNTERAIWYNEFQYKR